MVEGTLSACLVARERALDNLAPRSARGTDCEANCGRGGGHWKMLAPREPCGGRLRGRPLCAHETPAPERGAALSSAPSRANGSANVLINSGVCIAILMSLRMAVIIAV